MPPFHATTFQSGLTANPTRAGLDILQACAHRLLYELNVEGLATGLDVFVEASPSMASKDSSPLLSHWKRECTSFTRAALFA